MWSAVLVPTGVLHNLVGQIVALAAQGVRPVDAQVGIGKEIGDQLARRRGLAEFVAALQDVGPLEPWGPFGPAPPNSRLSSLLWQSVQRICVPMARPVLRRPGSACWRAGWAAGASCCERASPDGLKSPKWRTAESGSEDRPPRPRAPGSIHKSAAPACPRWCRGSAGNCHID